MWNRDERGGGSRERGTGTEAKTTTRAFRIFKRTNPLSKIVQVARFSEEVSSLKGFSRRPLDAEALYTRAEEHSPSRRSQLSGETFILPRGTIAVLNAPASFRKSHCPR